MRTHDALEEVHHVCMRMTSSFWSSRLSPDESRLPGSASSPPVLPVQSKQVIKHALEAHGLAVYAKHAELLGPMVDSLDRESMTRVLKEALQMKRGHINQFLSCIWCGPGSTISAADFWKEAKLPKGNKLESKFGVAACIRTCAAATDALPLARGRTRRPAPHRWLRHHDRLRHRRPLSPDRLDAYEVETQ